MRTKSDTAALEATDTLVAIMIIGSRICWGIRQGPNFPGPEVVGSNPSWVENHGRPM